VEKLEHELELALKDRPLIVLESVRQIGAN
jgi:hypothetical protein